MYQLKEKIFTFFGKLFKEQDSYKDENGRGIFERVQRVFGEEYDESIGTYIDNIVENLIPPFLMMDKFVPLWEEVFSISPIIKEDLAFRRKLLAYIVPIYKILGLEQAYHVMFRLAGFTSVEVVYYGKATGFDSPLNLDDPFRRLDTQASNSYDYALIVTGELPNSGATQQLIGLIIQFVEPLYANARQITYNEDDVNLSTVLILIDEEGYLQVDYENDPNTVFTLTDEGDLIVEGANENKYSINEEGELIFDETK